MKVSKKYIIAIIFCSMAATLTACGSPMKSKAKHDAKQYIKEKYGITATPGKVSACTVDGLFSLNTTGEYLVEMKYEDQEFMVMTSLSGIDLFRDNYQAEEIKDALQAEIAACVGVEPYYCQLIFDNNSFDEFDRNYDNFFHGYYDGDNLYQILVEGYDGKINLAYVDSTPVSQVDITEVGQKISAAMREKGNATYFCLYVGLFSFDSVENFEKNLGKISSNEVFPFTHELRDDFVDMYDAKYISYKAKKGGDKMSFAALHH